MIDINHVNCKVLVKPSKVLIIFNVFFQVSYSIGGYPVSKILLHSKSDVVDFLIEGMFFVAEIPHNTDIDHYICRFFRSNLELRSEIGLVISVSVIGNEGMFEVIHLFQMFALYLFLDSNVLLLQTLP